MADIPPDVVERIQRNWSTIPADVQDRLMRAGIGGSSTTTTKTTTPGWGTTAAEVAGGTLGGLAGAAIPGFGAVGGPIVGAGVGTAAGGALADYAAGRPNRLETAAKRGLTGAASEGVGRAVAVPVNAAGRAVARGVSEHFPGATRTIQRIVPKAIDTGGEALTAVKALGGTSSTPLEAGVRGQHALGAARDSWWAEQDPLFRGIEGMAGDADVVPTRYLQEASQGVLDESALPSAKAPITAARRLSTMGRREASAARDAAAAPEGLVDQFGRPAVTDAATEDPQAVYQKALANHALTFREARLLESQLGAMTRGAPTEKTRQAKVMLTALKKGMEEFLDSDAGGAVAPELAAAKQQYRIEKQAFYESPLGRTLKMQAGKVLPTLFNPRNADTLLEFRQKVPEEVWQDTVATWADQLYQKSVRNGRFEPAAFAQQIDTVERAGTLQYIVPSAERKMLLELRDRFVAMAPGDSTLAGDLGKRAMQAVALGAIGYETFERRGQDVEQHPGAIATTLGALSALHPAGRAVYGRLLPQAGGQALMEALRGRPY